MDGAGTKQCVMGLLLLRLDLILQPWLVRTHHIDQAGLKPVAVFLPIPLKCWNYRCAAAHPTVFSVLKVERSRAGIMTELLPNITEAQGSIPTL